MNSIISLHNAGAIVNVSGSRFERLTTCGSIVKNTFADLGQPQLKNWVN